MKIFTFIKSIDFFGPEMKFRINKQENFKTVFGGMISLLYYTALLSFFIIFGGDFFYKKNPKIISQVFKDTSTNKTKRFSNNNFFFAFRIVTLDSRNLDLNINKHNFNMSHQIIKEGSTEYTEINFLKCTQTQFRLLTIDNKADFNCADFSTIQDKQVGGNYDSLNSFSALINFNILFNENFLKNSIGKNNTEEYLSLQKKGIYLEILIAQPVFDPNDYSNPLKLDKKFSFAVFYPESSVYDQAFLNDFKVETDDGILIDNVSTAEMTGFGSLQRNFHKNYEPEYIASYSLELLYQRDYFLWTRQYMKFQDLLGNVNGFMEMIVFVFSFFISFNSDYRLNKYIANKLIYIVDSDFKVGNKIILNHQKNKNLEEIGNFKSSDISHILSNINNKSIKNASNILENNIDLAKIDDDSSSLSRRNIKGDKNKIDITSNKSNFDKSNNNLLLSPEKSIQNQESVESLKLKINFAKMVGKKNKENGKVLEYSFMDHLFRSKICKYQKNYDDKTSNRIIAEKIADKVFKKFDILYYLRILNQFENIVKVIFDNHQSNLFRSISKKVYFYKLNKKDRKIEFIRDEDKIKETDYVIKHYSQLNNSKELSVIDSKLLSLFDRIVSS